jgi:hypothetical protein
LLSREVTVHTRQNNPPEPPENLPCLSGSMWWVAPLVDSQCLAGTETWAFWDPKARMRTVPWHSWQKTTGPKDLRRGYTLISLSKDPMTGVGTESARLISSVGTPGGQPVAGGLERVVGGQLELCQT